MSAMASQIANLTTVYSIVYLGADQRKHQSSASLAFVKGIHRWPVNSPQKGPVARKMFPFDDVIMLLGYETVYVMMAYQSDTKPEYLRKHKGIHIGTNEVLSRRWNDKIGDIDVLREFPEMQ